MATKQGDVTLLDDPVAQELLNSNHMAQLAYVCPDGTPRVIPIWFHWDGKQLVVASFPNAPKLDMLANNPKVALTINTETWPYKVLMIRGTVQIESMDGVVPEYASCAERYFGEEQGKAWVEQVGGMFSQSFRIPVQPEWVGILDFEQRFPSMIEAAMAN